MVGSTNNKETSMAQYDMTATIQNVTMKQTTPDNPNFHSAVANAVSLEQLRNWDTVSEDELSYDYLCGYNLGKIYVVQAITNYLKATFPILDGEQITIVLESETLDPELSIELPPWFCWDDGDGALYGKGEDDALYLVPDDD
tara:strand:+ start:210 stop:635 length:426 start_codon:yes stop_codon:yes gene_type:complete